jgi:hypothetical protein
MRGVDEYLTIASLILIVAASVITSAMFAVRVLHRHKDDHFSWAILGLLSSVALSSTSALLRFTFYGHIELWIGQVLRTIAAILVIWATWPLIKDSWREFMAWACVWCTKCIAAINKKR